MHSFVYDPHPNIPLRFSGNSEEFASELPEILEELFPRYYICTAISSNIPPHNSMLPVAKRLICVSFRFRIPLWLVDKNIAFPQKAVTCCYSIRNQIHVVKYVKVFIMNYFRSIMIHSRSERVKYISVFIQTSLHSY